MILPTEGYPTEPVRVKTPNVAGNRESKAPGIGTRVERFMAAVFKRLGSGQNYD